MDEHDEFDAAPSWGLLLWGLCALPVSLAVAGLAGWDAMQGAAVRGAGALLAGWGRVAAAAEKLGADKRRGEVEL